MVRVLSLVMMTLVSLWLGAHFGWTSTPYVLWLLGYVCGVVHGLAIDLSLRHQRHSKKSHR